MLPWLKLAIGLSFLLATVSFISFPGDFASFNMVFISITIIVTVSIFSRVSFGSIVSLGTSFGKTRDVSLLVLTFNIVNLDHICVSCDHIFDQRLLVVSIDCKGLGQSVVALSILS